MPVAGAAAKVLILVTAAVSLAGCAGASLTNAVAPANGLASTNSASYKVAGHETNTAKAAVSKITVKSNSTTAYKVGPQDVLDITVFKVSELSKTVQVSDAGTINYPLLGEITVAENSAREIEQTLTKMLAAKYLQNPQVTVFIKEYNSQKVTVEGAVKKPGVFPIRGGMTLLQSIATAEGLTELSDEVVVVFRHVNGERKAAKYDVAAIRTGSKADIPLQAGDVVVVGTSAIKKGWNSLMKGAPLARLLLLL